MVNAQEIALEVFTSSNTYHMTTPTWQLFNKYKELSCVASKIKCQNRCTLKFVSNLVFYDIYENAIVLLMNFVFKMLIYFLLGNC